MLKSKDIRRVLIHCDADHVTFQRPNLGKDSHTTTGLGGLDRSHCKGHDRRAVACKDPASESKALRLAHTLHSRDNDPEGMSSDSAAIWRTTILLTCNLRPSHSSSCPRSTTASNQTSSSGAPSTNTESGTEAYVYGYLIDSCKITDKPTESHLPPRSLCGEVHAVVRRVSPPITLCFHGLHWLTHLKVTSWTWTWISTTRRMAG